MSGSYLNQSERNSMMTRFIVVYVICILFAIIPLYSLFNLPGWAEAKRSPSLKIERKKGEIKDVTLDEYRHFVFSLDSLLKTANLESDYRNKVDSLDKLAAKIIKTNPYGEVMKKVADLYNGIAKYSYENAKYLELKKDFEDLKEENKKLDEEMKKCTEKLEDLEKEKKNGNDSRY